MNKLLRLASGKAEPPPRSPERVVLAAAIEKHSSAVRELDATNQAYRQVRAQIYHDDDAAEVLVEKARAAVETAKENAVTRLTNTIPGAGDDASLSVEAARTALREAEDKLQALLEAKPILASRLEVCERNAARAKREVDEAIRHVVRSESASVRNLLVKYESVKVEFERLRLDLFWFWRQNMMPDKPREWGCIEPLQIDAGSAGPAPWRDALEQLAINADAPLPAS
jgi:hypothetical protein